MVKQTVLLILDLYLHSSSLDPEPRAAALRHNQGLYTTTRTCEQYTHIHIHVYVYRYRHMDILTYGYKDVWIYRYIAKCAYRYTDM